MGAMINTHTNLVGKPERKRPLRRLRLRWDDSIRMVLREIRREFVDWIHPNQDRDQWRVLVKKVMNIRVP
jgi:hypothetical protein